MTTARIAIDRAHKAPARTATRPATRKARAEAIPEEAFAPTQGEFAELYSEYFGKVFAYIYGRVQDREISLDIVADVFEKAYVKVASLRSRDSFGSWLFTIARNEVSSHWRKEKPAQKAVREAGIEKELHSQPKSPEEILVHKERLAFLSTLVRGLPKREQEIIALKFDAELTNREIAGVLSTSEVNVRVTIFRALRKLRDRMKNLGDSLG